MKFRQKQNFKILSNASLKLLLLANKWLIIFSVAYSVLVHVYAHIYRKVFLITWFSGFYVLYGPSQGGGFVGALQDYLINALL